MGASLLEGSAGRSRPERELGIARRSRLRACTTRTGERAAWGLDDRRLRVYTGM